MTSNPDGETVTLDPIPGIPALAANARVAADLLFVDPPPAYWVTVTEYDVTVQGRGDGIEAWALRHHLTHDHAFGASGSVYNRFKGVIEGVNFVAISVVTS